MNDCPSNSCSPRAHRTFIKGHVSETFLFRRRWNTHETPASERTYPIHHQHQVKPITRPEGSRDLFWNRGRLHKSKQKPSCSSKSKLWELHSSSLREAWQSDYFLTRAKYAGFEPEERPPAGGGHCGSGDVHPEFPVEKGRDRVRQVTSFMASGDELTLARGRGERYLATGAGPWEGRQRHRKRWGTPFSIASPWFVKALKMTRRIAAEGLVKTASPWHE